MLWYGLLNNNRSGMIKIHFFIIFFIFFSFFLLIIYPFLLILQSIKVS